MLYLFRRNEKFGLINARGEEVVAPRFFGLGRVTEEGVVATVEGDLFGVIDHSGAFRIPPLYKTLGNHFSCGLLAAENKDGFGFIDVKGETAVKFAYVSASHFSEDHASVKIEDRHYVFIDKSGRIVTKGRGFEEVRFYSNGCAGVVLQGKMGFVDLNGVLIVEARFDRLATGSFSEGYASVSELLKTELKSGLINKKGHMVLPLEFAGVGGVHDGIARVSHFGGGEAFVRVFSMDHSDLFDEVTDFCDSHAFVKKGNDWMVVNSQFELINRVFCDNVHPFRSGAAIIETDSKDGLVDVHGTVLVPCEFDDLQYVDGVLYEFVRDRESGYIDLKGNVVWSSLK